MIYLGKFHHDLTVLPSPGIMVNKRNHPQMALIQVSEILYHYMSITYYSCLVVWNMAFIVLSIGNNHPN